MASRLSQEEENYIRMCLLMTGISTRAARIVFDREFAPSCLDSTLRREIDKLRGLQNKGKINQIQWNLLFRNKPNVADSKTFDVTLMITLLRHLTDPNDLTPPCGGYECLPSAEETTPTSDLARIKFYRNFVAHLVEEKIEDTEFTTAWDIITNAISRLGGKSMKKECDVLKVKLLDQSNPEILLVIKRSNDAKKELKKLVESLQKANENMKIEMKLIKMSQKDTVPCHTKDTINKLIPNCLRPNRFRFPMTEGGSPLQSLPDIFPSERDLFVTEIYKNLRSKHTLLSYWRRGLTEVLKDYDVDEAEGKKVLNFLLSTFRFAILVAKKHGPGGTVKILYQLLPFNMNLISWRRILIGMNLLLDEPDINNDIRLIGVTISKKYEREITIKTFDEFSRLLSMLKDCNWQVLQTIIDMPQGYPMALLEILDYCKVHDIAPDSKQRSLKIVYDIHLYAMRQLGFYRANPTEPVLWERPANNAHLTFISILYAFYGSLIRDLPRSNNSYSLPVL